MSFARFVLPLIVFFYALVPSPFAGQAACPTDFRGILFGAKKEELSGFIPFTDSQNAVQANADLYTRVNEDLHFGQAEVQAILYAFKQGRLYSVHLIFRGEADAFLSKEKLIALYGTGKQIGSQYGWGWDNFSVVMKKSMASDLSVLTYTLETFE